MALTDQPDPHPQADGPRGTVRLTISYPAHAFDADTPEMLEARLICDPQGTDIHWTGSGPQQLREWINQQLDRIMPGTPPEAAASNSVSDSKHAPEWKPDWRDVRPPAQPVSIGDSQLDPPVAEELDMEFVDLTLRPEDCAAGNQPRMMEASGRLRVYVHSDEQASEKLPFRIEFILTDLDSGKSQTAAIEFGDVQPGEWAKEIRRSFPIPAKGNYRIKALVRKSSNGMVVAESAGPTLRVVE